VTVVPSDRLEGALAPNYIIPLVLAGIALPVAVWQPWAGLPLGLFALFLLVQTALIRLQFTPTSLIVYRGDREIRSFPYTEWETWAIFWPPLPILFYFREVNSIHFLPIIFDPQQLRQALEKHLSHLPSNQP
jgi:hypothetical protein